MLKLLKSKSRTKKSDEASISGLWVPKDVLWGSSSRGAKNFVFCARMVAWVIIKRDG